MSLPTRECGLKPLMSRAHTSGSVTPHAGVWIETILLQAFVTLSTVTPHAGVWIETGRKKVAE